MTPDNWAVCEAFMREYRSTDIVNIGEDMGKYLPEHIRCYDIDECDITKTPLPNMHHTIICSDVFEHLYDPVRAAENIVKSLKPGGYLFFSAPSIWPEHNKPIDTYRYTETAIKWLFRDLKQLRCWKTREDPHPVYPTSHQRVSLIAHKVGV